MKALISAIILAIVTGLHSQTNRSRINFVFFESGSGTPVNHVTVSIYNGDTLTATANSDTLSRLGFIIPPGSYNFNIKKQGYLEKKFTRYSIKDNQAAFLRINMIRKPITAFQSTEAE
jgi:hypothetical protein